MKITPNDYKEQRSVIVKIRDQATVKIMYRSLIMCDIQLRNIKLITVKFSRGVAPCFGECAAPAGKRVQFDATLCGFNCAGLNLGCRFLL